jgi:MFS family permease
MTPASAVSPTRDNSWQLAVPSARLVGLHGLHVVNDGAQACLLLLLPLVAATAGFGAMEIGTMTSLHFLMGVLLAVPAAALSRRWGGLRVLLGGGLMGACALVLLPAADSAWTATAVLILAGVGFGVFHPTAFALLARWASPSSANRSMGYFTASGDIGRSLLTAALAVIVSTAAWQHISLWLGGFAAIGVAVAYRLCMRPARTARDTPDEQGLVEPAPAIGERCEAQPAGLWRNRGFLTACALGSLDALANSATYLFLPLILMSSGCTLQEAGFHVSLYLGGGVLGKVAFGPVADRLGGRTTLVLIQASIACLLIAIGGVESTWVLAVSVTALGTLSKASLPIVLAATRAALPARSIELGFGVNQTALGLATTLAPFVLGAAADLVSPSAAFGLSAGLSCLAAILALTDRARQLRTFCPTDSL